jgi:hypothetical protein
MISTSKPGASGEVAQATAHGLRSRGGHSFHETCAGENGMNADNLDREAIIARARSALAYAENCEAGARHVYKPRS